MNGVALEGTLICDEARIRLAKNFTVGSNASLGFSIEEVSLNSCLICMNSELTHEGNNSIIASAVSILLNS